MPTDVLLIAAGFVAGAMNAIAGGGSFLTFPALVFAGLPPPIANASSTVALFPGGLASIWAYRNDIRPLGAAPLWAMLVTSVGGGLAGAVLLLITSEHAFDVVIPWILLLATLTFAFGRSVGARLTAIGGIGSGPLLAVQVVLGIYGGYFGGAVGIMLMAAWSLLIGADVKVMTPVRLLLTVSMNGAAVLCFALAGAVRWHETLIMLVGAIVGGWVGAKVERFMPSALVRAVVIITGAIITTLFFIRAA